MKIKHFRVQSDNAMIIQNFIGRNYSSTPQIKTVETSPKLGEAYQKVRLHLKNSNYKNLYKKNQKQVELIEECTNSENDQVLPQIKYAAFALKRSYQPANEGALTVNSISKKSGNPYLKDLQDFKVNLMMFKQKLKT